jgi:hypothetical protein
MATLGTLHTGTGVGVATCVTPTSTECDFAGSFSKAWKGRCERGEYNEAGGNISRSASAISRLSPDAASADREVGWLRDAEDKTCAWSGRDESPTASLLQPCVEVSKTKQSVSGGRAVKLTETALQISRMTGRAPGRFCESATEDIDLNDVLGVLVDALDPDYSSPGTEISADASNFGQISEVAFSVSSASDMHSIHETAQMDALPMLHIGIGDEALGCDDRFMQTWDRGIKSAHKSSEATEDSDLLTMIEQQSDRIRRLECELEKSRSEVAALQRMLEKYLRGESASTPDVHHHIAGVFSPLTPAYVATFEPSRKFLDKERTQAEKLRHIVSGSGFTAGVGQSGTQNLISAPTAAIDGEDCSVFEDSQGFGVCDRRLLPGIVDAVVSRSSSARNLVALDEGAQITDSDKHQTGKAASFASGTTGNVPETRLGNQCAFAPFHDGTFLFPSRQAAEACSAAREVFGPAAEALEKMNYRQQMAAAARQRSRREFSEMTGPEGSSSVGTNGAPSLAQSAGSELNLTTKRRSRRGERHARPLGTTRYWADVEHELFLLGCKKFGPKNFAAIAGIVKSRSPKQVRTHLQKYQLKLLREARRMEKVDGGAALAQLKNVCDMAFTKAQLRALGADESVISQQSLRHIRKAEQLLQSRKKAATSAALGSDHLSEEETESSSPSRSSSLSLSLSSSSTVPTCPPPGSPTAPVQPASAANADASTESTLPVSTSNDDEAPSSSTA